jgi:hypothetical protein
MNFFINKNSTLPVMKLDVIQDGRHDMKKIYELIQNSNIYFSMYDASSGKKIIGKNKALCLPKTSDLGYDEYYLAYQFSEKETSKPGVYIGQFIINFLDDYGTLIVPIRQKLHIHILENE